MVRLVRAGEGHRFSARGSEMLFKAVADTTGGTFSLMDRTLPPGGRMPPPHRHGDADEAYYVLAGRITFRVEGRDMVGEVHDFLHVPRGVGHTFGNLGDRPARLLVLHAPAKDAYFAELHDLWHREQDPTVAEEQALMARHGMQPVVPSPET